MNKVQLCQCSNAIFLNWDDFPSGVMLLFYVYNQEFFFSRLCRLFVCCESFEKILCTMYEVYRSKFSLHPVLPCYVKLCVADVVNFYR